VRLGAHWPSDIIAGFLLGLAWLGVVIVALRRGERGTGGPVFVRRDQNSS
jgi:membrane-associated phospholipid phosphatase